MCAQRKLVLHTLAWRARAYARSSPACLQILLLKLLTSFRKVEQGTAVIVERYGRFHRRLDAGLHFLVPFADKPRPIVWYVARTPHDCMC